MKIIEKGHIPPEVTYVMKCWYCGCKYTYAHKDKIYDETEFFPSPFVICPHCELNNTIPFFEKKYKEDKKLKKIKYNYDDFYDEYLSRWTKKTKNVLFCEVLANKINELIDEINKLKEDK